MASELVRAGYAGSFNFGEVLGSDYAAAQLIARWAYNAGYGGIAYLSAHDSSLTCWAFFDHGSVTAIGVPEAIDRNDPDLIAAAELFGLTLPE